MKLLEKLETLIQQSDLSNFQNELDLILKNEEFFETFENGDNLFHRVVRAQLNEEDKINFVFKLSDTGLDINVKNKTHEQTCLHLAVIGGLVNLVYCLLQNGADLTIVDQIGLCSYNYAKRLEDKEISKRIIQIMQSFYPTYWIGIDNMDIDIIRRLINSWCKFKITRNGKSLIDYAIDKRFKAAYDLFLSLEAQMDLCFAVMACNVKKVEMVIKTNHSTLRMNFKNMKEKGATIFYYALKHNNIDLLKILLNVKSNILNECILDESDVDYPLYFYGLALNLDHNCLKLITPEAKDSCLDISQLFYRGKSFLRYSIEIGLDTEILEYLIDLNYCSKELMTVKDPNWLTSKEYALKVNKIEYANLIDKITVKYILNSKSMREQLAFNGFDFSNKQLLAENGKDLKTYAAENDLVDVVDFLESVDEYQKKVAEFHKIVEKNDYYGVKALYKIDPNEKGFEKLRGNFQLNLIFSKTKGESQTVLHKCALNSYFQILELILELILENLDNGAPKKMDNIRDHCYRTPFHYACGMEENKRIIQLLSQYGFSENVYDKDGMTPLDFQERVMSEELQELIEINKLKKFKTEEPNPWTWKVWTRIQSEKDTLKQLISYSNPLLMLQINRGHSHNHGHGHGHGHSHNHSHSHNDHQNACSSDYLDIEDEINQSSNCLIL